MAEVHGGDVWEVRAFIAGFAVSLFSQLHFKGIIFLNSNLSSFPQTPRRFSLKLSEHFTTAKHCNFRTVSLGFVIFLTSQEKENPQFLRAFCHDKPKIMTRKLPG